MVGKYGIIFKMITVECIRNDKQINEHGDIDNKSLYEKK